MDTYWPAAIIMNESDTHPWFWANSGCETTLDAAKGVIKKLCSTNKVLCAWIDKGDGKPPIYFKCFVDFVGNVRYE